MGSSSGHKYDESSVESIVEYAKLLIGKSLAEASSVNRASLKAKGKGGLGVLVEWAFFDLELSNKPEPDFEKAELELKTTGLIRKNGQLQAKERLKLTSIDYFEFVDEDWMKSRVVRKCGRMLLLTYLYEANVELADLRFHDLQLQINLLDPLSVDTAQFQRDYERIQRVIRDGKAHELSSGDTLYLEAITSGAGKGRGLKRQPFSSELAKPRALAIKSSYLNALLQGSTSNALLFSSEATLETETARVFRPYLELSITEIAKRIGLVGSPQSNKGYHRALAISILANGGSSVPELQKADIELKTIRAKASGNLREAMSFPGFKYLDLVEESWESSDFCQRIERKFLFVVFQEDSDGTEVLRKVGYWNMPFSDREVAREVWEETQRRVVAGNYVFPKSSESTIAHVRPKAKNAQDLQITPQGTYEKKYAFWLNRSYLEQVVRGL